MAEQRTTITLPFSQGFQTREDKRASSPPMLDRCVDAEFDEIGGLRTRHPYANIGVNILGGGTIANPRRLAANGDELLLFTDISLYSWSVRDTAWVLKGTHLAIKVTEQTVLARAEDQVDCDRAELGNTVFFCWSGTDLTSQLVKVAAIDKTTGAVILSPTIVDPGLPGSSPRLVALGTKVLLVWIRNIAASVYGLVLDPANVAASIVAPTLIVNTGTAGNRFDVVKIPGADSAYLVTSLNPTTSYTLVKITAALALASATKARACDGAIAVSIDPTGTLAQIVRGNATNVQGDLLNVTTNADVFINQAVGTIAAGTVSHVAAAHRSVQNGGQYRCYAFWSSAESAGAGVNWTSKVNFVDTGNTLGTQANFVRLLAPASRAFDYGGSVFVWGVFAGTTSASVTGFVSQLQNTLFLYRDDATLHSKATFDVAGGLPSLLRLPGVANIGGTTFAFCNNVRRRVPIGGSSSSLGYAERAPRDIVFTFDSNEARRTARLGPTLYVSGGEILQYDGTGLYEVGFHIYPWAIGASPAAAGAIVNGTYAYKSTWKWPNAKGDVDRSTTATVINGVQGAGPSGFDVTMNPLYTTRKTAQPPAAEVWRTQIAPGPDSPFFLVSSGDSSVLAGSNRYVPNDTTVFPLPVFHDALADASIGILEANPENEGVLESLAPPGATIIVASDTRLFLAGVAGDADRVWYSRLRNAFEVAAFAEELVFDVPRAGGAITAIAFVNETLTVFRERAIYAFQGDGFDNTGNGQNYGPARIISLEVGAVSQESVALVADGLLFKSSKGWYVLNRGWGIDYVGAGPYVYDAEQPVSVQVVGAQQQIRIATASRVLMWDTLVKQWGEWSPTGALDAVAWNGLYHVLTSAGVFAEQSNSYAGTTYGMDVETSWLKPDDLAGQFKCRWIMPLGEVTESDTLIRMRVARNYESDGAGGVAYFDDLVKTPATTIGGPLQVRHGPSLADMEAVKVRLTAVTESVRALIQTVGGLDAVHTSGTNWNALINALPPFVGEYGNQLFMTIGFDLITTGTFTIVVHDNQTWNQLLQMWTPQNKNVGVRVQLRAASAPTVAQLEAAITAGSTLCAIGLADPTPSKVITAASMGGTTAEGQFAGGTYGAPSAAGMKLTGIGFEVGARPGLYKLLPQAQKA